MAHISSLYFQQEEFTLTNISLHLLPNWEIMPDHWRVTQERELPMMISPRKITYERSKSCRPRRFRLYAPISFATVHLSNTSAVINTMCRVHNSPYCFSSDRVKCLIYSVKETALWLISRVPQHVGPFNPTASSTRLTWSLRGETTQDLRSRSVMPKDLNHLSIREVFRDSYNLPLLTLHFHGRSSINVLNTASIVSPLTPL